MREKRTHLSSIERSGISIGLTQNVAGTQFFSAYASGFWLSILVIDQHGNGSFEGISVVPMLLHALGTQFENRARVLAGHISACHFQPDEFFEEEFQPLMNVLKSEMAAAGLLDTSKKSLHVTGHSLGVLEAGGSQSGRLNAILARYEAIMRNPEIAFEVAQTEAIEQALKKAGTK